MAAGAAPMSPTVILPAASGDEATRVLSAAGAAEQTAQTERLNATARLDRTAVLPQAGSTVPAAAQRSTRRSGSRVRRRPLIIGALVALAAVIALVFLVQPRDPAPEPPAYPVVDGDLGTHLQQLQESVNP